MKIKFFSNYEHSENLLKRFKSNYIIYDDHLAFTTGNDYDFAVVFNSTSIPLKAQAKVITIIQEPSWSDAHDYLEFLAYSDYLIVHDRDVFEWTNQLRLGGELIISPCYLFYTDRVDHSFFYGKEHIKKEKIISMIVSSLHFNIGNYIKRLNLLGKILESDLNIDLYGRGFKIPDSRYKGEIKYKYDGLMPYEYSIAIENCNERNYITEKFFDCSLCNTIPIYNGAPNVSEVYDDRFFKTIDLDSPTIIDDIKEIISVPAPYSNINKEIYFEKYNLYTRLKEIILGN